MISSWIISLVRSEFFSTLNSKFTTVKSNPSGSFGRTYFIVVDLDTFVAAIGGYWVPLAVGILFGVA